MDKDIRRTLEYQAARWSTVITFIDSVTKRIGADASLKFARSIDLYMIGKCSREEEGLIDAFKVEMSKECEFSPEDSTDPTWPILQLLLTGCGAGAMASATQASEINFRNLTSKSSDHSEIENFVRNRIKDLGINTRGTRNKVILEIQEQYDCKETKAKTIYDKVKKKCPQSKF